MLAFSMLVSLSFFFGKFIAKDIDPSVLMALRFALASVVVYIALKAVGLAPILTSFWRFLLIGGCMALYFITMFEALRLTSAVSTSAVFTLTPLLAAGFGWIFVHQRPRPWLLSALLVGAAGAIWVIFRADLAALLRFEIGPGEAIFLIGTIAHGAVPALLQRFCKDVTALQSAFGTTIGALIVTCAWAAPDIIATDYIALPSRVWWVLAYLAIVTTAGTFALLQYASKCLPGPKVMAYTYLVPTWVVLSEIVVLGTYPAPLIFLGIAATLAALLMLLRAEVP